MRQMSVSKELCREERETEILKVCKLSPKGEISTPTLNRKLNWLFKENAQLRDDHLRLKQTWTQEIRNKDMLILLSIKPVDNSNLRDWSFIRRISGQIRFKEKRLIYAENWKREIDSFKKIAQEIAKKLMNYEESVAKKQIKPVD